MRMNLDANSGQQFSVFCKRRRTSYERGRIYNDIHFMNIMTYLLYI